VAWVSTAAPGCQVPKANASTQSMCKMTEVQSQSTVLPDNIIRAQEADRDALVVRLDDLLGKYLHTLDEYQKVREQLSKQLSSVSR
jgi:hypothetical protein